MGMIEVTTTSANISDEEECDPIVLTDEDGRLMIDRLIQSAGESHTGSEHEMHAFLAGELNKMSLQERQKVFEELHGVCEQEKRVIIHQQETPEFVAEQIATLEEEIANIHPKDAYELAESINIDYVQDESFRLTFLRADLFNAVKAARRIVTFFECRLALFGPELLTRSITLLDLDKDDLSTLKSGYFQILPSRDTAGRAVLINVQGMFKRAYKRSINMQRMYHYLHCAMAEDLETQLHGYVFVMYQIGKFEYDPPPDLFNGRSNLFMQGSPVRICGMHMCQDHPIMKAIYRVILAISGAEARARNRFHEGSSIEVKYALSSFGIPVDLIPITPEAVLKKGNHIKWINMRKAKESIRMSTAAQFASRLQNENDLKVDLPGRNDVLMGKGKPVQQHAGNVAMRSIVCLYVPEYNAAAKHMKSDIVQKVCSAIQSKGRFLKRHQKGWWIVASDEEIRDKVGKTFTSEQFKAKRLKSIQTVNSEFGSKRIREEESTCFGKACGSGDADDYLSPSSVFGDDIYHIQKRHR